MLRLLFNSNRPVVLLALLLPAAGAAALAALYQTPPTVALAGPLYDLLFAKANESLWLSAFLGVGVVFVGAVLLNSIFNEHEFADRTNYLPAFVYFIFGVSSLEWVFLNPVFIANVLLMLSLRRLLRISRVSNATGMLFDSGIFIALAVLVYPLIAFAIPFLWIGMTILRSVSFREWLLPALGIATVAFYAVAAYWWFEIEPALDEFYDLQHQFTFGGNGKGLERSSQLWFLGVSVLPFLLGLGRFIRGMGISTVHRKNTKRVFLWLSFFLFAVMLYAGFLVLNDHISIGLIGMPLAVFSSLYFSTDRRRWLVDLMFFVWIIFSIVSLIYSAQA